MKTKGSQNKLPEQRRRTRWNLFTKILKAYGSKCACPSCDELNPKMLTLDHKEGGGNKDRKEVNWSNLEIYRKVLRAGCPPIYQLLCWSCNCGKQRNNGICPHLNSWISIWEPNCSGEGV